MLADFFLTVHAGRATTIQFSPEYFTLADSDSCSVRLYQATIPYIYVQLNHIQCGGQCEVFTSEDNEMTSFAKCSATFNPMKTSTV